MARWRLSPSKPIASRQSPLPIHASRLCELRESLAPFTLASSYSSLAIHYGRFIGRRIVLKASSGDGSSAWPVYLEAADTFLDEYPWLGPGAAYTVLITNHEDMKQSIGVVQGAVIRAESCLLASHPVCTFLALVSEMHACGHVLAWT